MINYNNDNKYDDKNNTNKIIKSFLIINKYSMPFCSMSEIHPRQLITRREAELNTILPRVNNFDIKQKRYMEYLFYFMSPTPNKIWEEKS